MTSTDIVVSFGFATTENAGQENTGTRDACSGMLTIMSRGRFCLYTPESGSAKGNYIAVYWLTHSEHSPSKRRDV